MKIEFDKEMFDKSIKENGIIRWIDFFEKVVKTYLRLYNEKAGNNSNGNDKQ